jgi:hypothetical protein
MTSEELEGRLLDEAQKAIKKLVVQHQACTQMNLSQIEDLVGAFETELSPQVMQVLVESTPNTVSPSCPVCGGYLRKKGQHRRRIVTVRGEIEVQREYVKCADCGDGFFPLG